VDAPTWVILGLLGGLALLGSCAFGCVWSLQSDAMEEVAAEQGRRLEIHLDGMIRRLAAEEFGGEHGSLERLGARLVGAMEGDPAILDLIVVDSMRKVVRTYSQRAGRVPCVANVPLDRPVDHEHPPGTVSAEAVACKSIPIVVGGVPRGVVFYHAERERKAAGTRVGHWVRRTALSVGAVFAVFYALLGALLFWATRALHRWRARAAAVQRVQALGALADGINHEIKNPLNALGLSLQLLGRRHRDAETRQVVETARREADRIRERLEQFSRFVRVARTQTEPANVGEFLRLRFGARAEVTGAAQARIDPSKLDAAVAEIVGFLELRGGGRPQLELSRTRRGWRLVSKAPANGLEPKGIEQLFDPFLPCGSHDVSCGLALARAVFEAHGGSLSARVEGDRLVLTATAPSIPPEEKR